MYGQIFLNVVMVFAGTVVFLLVWVLGRRYLSENHWLRECALAFMEHRGPLEMARLVGVLLLICAFAALTIAYS
jgi:hypothetical protein